MRSDVIALDDFTLSSIPTITYTISTANITTTTNTITTAHTSTTTNDITTTVNTTTINSIKRVPYVAQEKLSNELADVSERITALRGSFHMAHPFFWNEK